MGSEEEDLAALLSERRVVQGGGNNVSVSNLSLDSHREIYRIEDEEGDYCVGVGDGEEEEVVVAIGGRVDPSEKKKAPPYTDDVPHL